MLAPIGLLAAFPRIDIRGLLLLVPMLLPVARIGLEREEKNDKVLELKNAYQDLRPARRHDRGGRRVHGEGHRDVVELVLGVVDRLGLTADEHRMAEFRALCTTSGS